MKLCSFLSVESEELEVDSVEDKEDLEFDSTYAHIRAKIDSKPEEEATPPSDKESTPETPKETTPTNAVDAPPETDGKDTPANVDNVEEDKDSVNADAKGFHKEYDATDAVSQEDWRETRDNVASAIKEKTIDGLVYLKDIGIQYGPVVFAGIGRLTVRSIVGMAKSLVLGTNLIVTYFNKKIHSFKKLDDEINDLRAAYELCRTNNLEVASNEVYDDKAVISNLKIGSSAKFSENFVKGAVFVEKYLTNVDTEIAGVTSAVSRLISDVVGGHGISPTSSASDKHSYPFLEVGVQSNYRPSSNLIEAFHYQSVLPGDYLFIGYGPSRNITDKDEMATAYQDSKFFMGQSETSENVPSKVYVENIESIGKMLVEMDKLCKVCVARETKIPMHVKSRNGLKSKLNAYVRFILFAKNKSNEYDSLSHYLSNKLAFMDKTYINGEIVAHDYANRLLRYSIKYCRYVLRKAK